HRRVAVLGLPFFVPFLLVPKLRLGTGLLAKLCLALRRRRLQLHEPGPMQRQQHRLQDPFLRRDSRFIHESLPQGSTYPRNLRRKLEHVSQKPPRYRPLAIELAGRRPLELLELRLAPVSHALAARRLLTLECLLGPE